MYVLLVGDLLFAEEEGIQNPVHARLFHRLEKEPAARRRRLFPSRKDFPDGAAAVLLRTDTEHPAGKLVERMSEEQHRLGAGKAFATRGRGTPGERRGIVEQLAWIE